MLEALMPRTIQISHDVFAAIWRRQKAGEKSEDEILAREFGVEVEPEQRGASIDSGGGVDGYSEPRFGFSVPKGFEIHRTYIGTKYQAHAEGGYWVRKDNGQRYASLNELGHSIGAKTENAWWTWLFTDADGRERRVSELRDQSTIVRRSKR